VDLGRPKKYMSVKTPDQIIDLMAYGERITVGPMDAQPDVFLDQHRGVSNYPRFITHCH